MRVDVLCDGELYHHGVKGMKWGVRRFQKKDGSLTPAGKKRYSSGDSKRPTRQSKLEEKYVSEGYSREEASRLARGRVKTERVLIGIGTVAAVTTAGLVAYHMYDKRADRMIKAGRTIQTVHLDDAAERISPGNPFYASYRRGDNAIFSSSYNAFISSESKVTRFYSERGIKVASETTGRKVFEDLKRDNEAFRKYAEGIPRYAVKDPYKVFNGNLAVRKTTDDVTFNKMFYDALKQRGYGAVIDTNDTGWSFSPAIIFDDSVKHITTSTKVTSKDLGIAKRIKGELYVAARGFLTDPSTPMSTAVLAGSVYTSSKVLKNNRGSEEFVKQYKIRHPNTKLTDAQISKLNGV